MKQTLKRILLFCFIIWSNLSYCQYYGNEWIDYSQTYYKFPIVQTGIYKLDYATLINSGIPVSSFSSSNIQMFGKEQEIPLYIVDGGDDILDAGDYILFYAEKNDGWLDTTLYETKEDVGNPYYSLFNDTIQYFFTWNNSTSNLRYQVETDQDFYKFTPLNFVSKEVYQSYNNTYHEGIQETQLASSFYTKGEGWGKTKVEGTASSGYTIGATANTSNLYVGVDAPNAYFEAFSVGESAASPNFLPYNHHHAWKIGPNNHILSDQMTLNYETSRVNTFFPVSELTNGNTNITWSIIDDLNVASDWQAINYWKIIFPQTPNLNNSLQINKFDFKNSSSDAKVRIDFQAINYNQPLVFIHGSQPKKVDILPYNGGYSCIVSNSTNGVDQTLIYQDLSTVSSISQLNIVNQNGKFTDFSNTNIEEALILIYHPDLIAASVEYNNYRKSIQGGNYNTILANIEELYLQFGGGINHHINGVRRFSHMVYNLATEKPVGLFLMGKGILNGIDNFGSSARTNIFHQNLIPTFGSPSSDNCITANLNNNHWTPLIPTGRIAARDNQMLQDYLEKVITHESYFDSTSVYNSDEKDWQKHIMHFAGGQNFSEQNIFQYYLENMENTIESTNYAGSVSKVYTSSDTPLDPFYLNQIIDRIQKGVSLITYFGHSYNSPSGFEINIDEPSNWQNQNRYPLMLINSCFNGNIFKSSNSYSEKFVTPATTGAIAYIAHVNYGFSNSLANYSSEFYRQLSQTSYNQNLGTQIQSTIQQLENLSPTLSNETAALQMTLHGDPMLHIYSHVKPEIELTANNITFSPQSFDLSTDSVEIQVVVKNLGRSINTDYNISITRDFPNSNIDSTYLINRPFLNYTDTVTFKVPLQANIGIGINNITVSVDIPTFHDEVYDELYNNQITKQLFIDIDDINPIFPYDYAVVPKDSVTLIASTTNPIADFNSYIFEIDTTDLFNSPFKKYAIINSLGGVIEVNPSLWLNSNSNQNSPLVCVDSMAYFWRVSLNTSTPIWKEKSFQYITGKTGWGQDHFFQFKNNYFNNVEYDRNERQRNFELTENELKNEVHYGLNFGTRYFINGEIIGGTICDMHPSLHVAVIDPGTITPWKTCHPDPNCPYNFGNTNNGTSCTNSPMTFFKFNQNNPTARANFINMIENEIPDGHYILIWTTFRGLFSAWEPAVFQTFTDLGSDSIVPGRPDLHFSFFCVKGDPNSVSEVFAQTTSETIFNVVPILGLDNHGHEFSTLIGPASNWGNVYWKQDPLETSSTTDSTILHIKAFNNFGVEQFTIDTLFTNNDSIINLQNLINANSFPYIKLSAEYFDSTIKTPAQIDRWHVLYTPLPEAVIDGSTGYTWEPFKDTIQEGEDITFAVDVRNIFNIDMDSLLVNYWIEDVNHNIHPLTYPRQDSLRVDDLIRDTIHFSTIGLSGINSFWMEINPYINGSTYLTDQPEQMHINNVLQIPFFVEGDDKNPILDVTFNGRHLLNKDIIDPTSEILISLKDDNPYLIMDNISDTALFGVYITDPDGIMKKIPFVDADGNMVMSWTPADQQNKRFKISYPAYFEKDGMYTLLVQGADRSGNLSGDLEYKINFEVIHESSITYLMNYPNPFSTSTRFVFTLTGSEVPEEIIIQIMTVTGRVIREITEDELGMIQIGRNISEYAWDGTDEYGDPLANGVYLYTVKAQINGENIKHRDSGADIHFKKEFGKMYLMR
jgi:hypothetical protein